MSWESAELCQGYEPDRGLPRYRAPSDMHTKKLRAPGAKRGTQHFDLPRRNALFVVA